MLKPVVFVLGLLPLAWLVQAVFNDALGANPAEALVRSLGVWALRALVIVLAVTPVRVVMGWPWLARLRRMLGLYVFFYATLHWLAYAWFDAGFDLAAIVADIPRRPFILVGTLAWLLLAVLAMTSPHRVARLMGGRRWRALHRSIYAVAVLVVLHFFWMRTGKNDFAEVAVYAGLLGSLLGWRAWHRWRTAGGVRQPPP